MLCILTLSKELVASTGLLSSRPYTCMLIISSLCASPLLILHSLLDCVVITAAYKATTFLDSHISPNFIQLPHPYLYTAASFSLWALYSFVAGLFGMGLWVIGHECGHQAFSESKLVNNVAGWIIHSACVFAVKNRMFVSGFG